MVLPNSVHENPGLDSYLNPKKDIDESHFGNCGDININRDNKNSHNKPEVYTNGISQGSDEVFDETDLDFRHFEIPTPLVNDGPNLTTNLVVNDTEKGTFFRDFSLNTARHNCILADNADQPEEPDNGVSDPISKTFSIVKLNHNLPVDQGYSWVFMGLCCTLSAFSWGVNSGYSVFLAYYLSNDLFENATDMDFAFIGGFSFTMGFILSPLITIVMGKLGLKNSIFLGICCQSGGLIAASFAKKVWHLYLTQGILQGIGLAFMIMPINIITSHWFHRKKSLANGVIAAGSGLGGIIFSLSGQALLVSLGLAWALRIIGIITFSVNVICLTFIRHRGKEIPINYNSFSRSSLKILKRPHIFFFYAWSAPSMMAYCILLYSLSAYSVAMGFTHFQGAIVGSLLQVSSAVGRPLLGLFMDRVGCVNASVLVGFYCATIIFAIWIPATNLPLIYVFALLIGGPSSVVSVGVQPIGQDMASLDELPTLYAVVWTINGIFAVFSEVIGLKVRKLEWKYSFVFTQLFSGLAYLFGALLMLNLRQWKVQRSLTKELDYLVALKAQIDRQTNEKNNISAANDNINSKLIILNDEVCDIVQINAKIEHLQSVLSGGLRNKLARTIYRAKV